MADSKNYYSNMASTNNPGFNTQGSAMPVAKGGFDIVEWLKQAIQQMNTPQSDSRSQGGMAVSANKPEVGAYQKGNDKALEEAGYAHVQQAIQQGIDPLQIQSQRMQMTQQTPNIDTTKLLQGLISAIPQSQQMQTNLQQESYPNQALQQQQSLTPIQQQAQQLVQPKGFMGRWQENFNKQVGNVTTADKLGNLASAQKLLGQEPWQSGDVKKTMYEKSMAYETSKINKALEMDKLDITRASSYLDKVSEMPKFSGDELTKYSALQEMYDASLQLSKRLEKDPNALVTLGLPNDQYGQQTLLWANKIAANRKFFQGGTALTPMENKTLESILAKRGLGAVMQNPKVAKEAIDSISDKAKKVFSKMDVYADDREFINEARAMGYNDVSVMKALYKRRASTKGN